MYKLNKHKIIGNIVFFIIILIILFLFNIFYQKYNYNEFEKSEYYAQKTKFTRDNKVKYSKNSSYKLESEEYNDAIFYKKLNVEKNTVYKITCMVRTEGVQAQKQNSNAGAQISVLNTVEKSKNIIGTSQWQELELLLDSKDRSEIEIGFRLGGYDDNCKGTAWFSDFKIESGVKEESSEWNFALFICENLKANIEVNGEKKIVEDSMSQEEIDLMIDDFNRFKNSIKTLSGNQMTANIKIYEVDSPIESLSYDEENGYYVSSKDVENLIDDTVNDNKFDHIFVAVKFGDTIKSNSTHSNDWIGLGYMDYYGIGFSNIRLPNSKNNYIYKFSSTNTFPEEVFVHEFLHSLERNLNERNYNIPELHSYNQYGYKNSPTEGYKQWYTDYMQKKIKTSTGNAGLDSIVYKIKPVKEDNFNYSIQLNYFEEPRNIIESIKKLFSKFIN